MGDKRPEMAFGANRSYQDALETQRSKVVRATSVFKRNEGILEYEANSELHRSLAFALYIRSEGFDRTQETVSQIIAAILQLHGRK